jgi:putative endonuclease
VNAFPQHRHEHRKAAYRRGHFAEYIALISLMFKGYIPLARRYAAHGGEVDLILRRGNMLIFVEVKARATALAALEAVNGRKKRLFSRAAQSWIAHHSNFSEKRSWRADIVVVTPWRWPHHVKQAFELQIKGF